MFGVGEVTGLPAWAGELPSILPHGSGIDQDWVVEGHVHHITCRNSFHCMDESGMYEGWQDFSVILKKPKNPRFGISFKIHLHGYQYLGQKHMLKDCLGDDIAYALADFEWGRGVKKILRKSDAGHIMMQLENAKSFLENDHKRAYELIVEAIDILRNAEKEAIDVSDS